MIVAGIAGSRIAAVQRVAALRPEHRPGRHPLGWGIRVRRGQGPSGQRDTGRLIMISSHAEADYADLIAEAPVAGFLPKTELSAVAIRRLLGMA